MILGILPSDPINIYKKWQFIILAVLLMMGCVQTVEKPASVSEDEIVLTQGMKILADPEATDKSMALAAFIKACELGNNNACHKVGTAYNNGLYGKEKNYDQAQQWYMKAAEKGYIPSQLNIANIYAYRLLPLDDETGYAWLVKAGEGLRSCQPGSIEAKSATSDTERHRLCRLAKSNYKKLLGLFRKRMEGVEMESIEKTIIKDMSKNNRDSFRAE